MKNFNDLEVELPKFPVYKSYILPYRHGGDEIVDVLEVDSYAIEDWRKMLSYLHEFLRESLAIARLSDQDEVEKIELVNDLIVLFLRIPLVRELLPTIAPSPLKSYLFYRLNEPVTTGSVEDILDYVYAFYDKITKEKFSETSVSRFFDDLELCELVERCWFRIPADTRPGPNTCGLIPHILLSSAIAWALAIEEGLSRDRVAVLTLAALLHDIGKPIRYRDHVRVSVEVARELLKNLLSQEKVDEVVRLIELHHIGDGSVEVEIIKRADHIASRIDRLSSLLEDLLKNELNRISKETSIDIYRGYEGGESSWEIWEELHRVKPDAIRELSTLFVQRIRESLNNFQVVPKIVKTEDVKGVLIGLVDIGAIQEFIMATSELRTVVASSLIVDILTALFIPVEIQRSNLLKGRVPLGNITYAAGGVVEFIIPERFYDNVQEALENLHKKTSKIGLPIRVAHITLKDYYPATILELVKDMQIAKLEVDSSKQHITLSRSKETRELCQVCYLRTPVEDMPTPEGSKRVCNICKRLYEVGSELHFRSKYTSKITINNSNVVPRELFGKEWESIGKYILEVIAGHDEIELDKLKKHIIEYRDLAVIKLDGNLMGPLMASSISLADACERSARIDLALKKAMDEAIKQVFEAVREVGGDLQALKIISQIKLGLMYAGGDDALIFMPSWTSIGFTLVVGEEFCLNMGGARGLSIGLAVGKSKADIWGLITAASKLMKISKGEMSEEEICRRDPSSSRICFDVSDSLTLTESSVKTHLDHLKREGLTAQPLRFDGGAPSFKQLISLVISEDVKPREVFKNCYLISRLIENDQQSRAKHVRRAIAESLSSARRMVKKVKGLEDYLISLSTTYAYRQSRREELDELTRRCFETITKLDLSRYNGKQYSMYSDADRLIKISGGGAI
ncbi:MAG: HD domain-containing protein [Candidatus Caldarchaeales archaeon]